MASSKANHGTIKTVRKDAEIAWNICNYQKYISLYEPYLDLMNHKEKERYALAEKKIATIDANSRGIRKIFQRAITIFIFGTILILIFYDGVTLMNGRHYDYQISNSQKFKGNGIFDFSGVSGLDETPSLLFFMPITDMAALNSDSEDKILILARFDRTYDQSFIVKTASSRYLEHSFYGAERVEKEDSYFKYSIIIPTKSHLYFTFDPEIPESVITSNDYYATRSIAKPWSLGDRTFMGNNVCDINFVHDGINISATFSAELCEVRNFPLIRLEIKNYMETVRTVKHND